MKKLKKFPLAEFLWFIISAKNCVILDMSKAMEKDQKMEKAMEKDQKWQNLCANKAPSGTNNVFD